LLGALHKMLNNGHVPGGRGLEDVTARGFDERRSGGRFNGMARAAERRIRKATRFWRVSCRTDRACGTPASPLRIRAGASMPVPRLAGDAVAFRQCFIRQYAAVRRAPGEHSGVRQVSKCARSSPECGTRLCDSSQHVDPRCTRRGS